MAEPDERMVEAVARALCAADGKAPEPDAPIYIGLRAAQAWEGRAEQARAVLALPFIAAAIETADAANAALDADGKDHAACATAARKLENAAAAYRAARRDLEGGA